MLLLCFACWLLAGCGADRNDGWIDRLASLGLAARIGEPEASNRVTLITTLDCESCREQWQVLFPVIRAGLESGDVQLTLVDIMTDTPKNQAILEALTYARNLDPFAGLVLYDALVGSYVGLGDEPDPVLILESAGMAHEYASSAIDWSERITEALEINGDAGLTLLPELRVNGAISTAEHRFALREALENELTTRKGSRE